MFPPSKFPEPSNKRVITFIDGQALYRSSKDAFGYTHPNYDVNMLSQQIAGLNGWKLSKIHFYTGIPDMKDDPFWHQFWSRKLAVMGTRGVHLFSRAIRYQDEEVILKDGSVQKFRIGHEKGIDVRLALDVVRLALDNAYDVAVIFSQDQDLSEAVDEVRMIASKAKRWTHIASAYPISPSYNNRRGINGTQWIQINQALYEKCVDPNDYRPQRPGFNPVIK